MAAEVLNGHVNDAITGVQMRLVRERMADETARFEEMSDTTTEESVITPRAQLRQTIKRREELLRKIQQEQMLRDELERPTSKPQETNRLHSRQSLPDLRTGDQGEFDSPRRPFTGHGTGDQYYRYHKPRMGHNLPGYQQAEALYGPYQYRKGLTYHRPVYEQGDPNSNRTVVEHQFRPVRLEPMEKPSLPAPLPVQQVALAPTVISVPQPVYIGGGGGEKTYNSKQEMYELMMMQNAQMHQMVMQQLMMSSLPQRPRSPVLTTSSSKVAISLDELLELKKEKEHKRAPSVQYYYDPNNQRYPLPPLQVYRPAPSQTFQHANYQYVRSPRVPQLSYPQGYPVQAGDLHYPIDHDPSYLERLHANAKFVHENY